MGDELTSLGWLSAIGTVRNKGILTDEKRPSVPTVQSRSSRKKDIVQPDPRPVAIKEHNPNHRPPCSYSCLIAMALMASPTGCLPVHHIYRFIEQEYPFYRTAPEGWKNSIRHNLSMNQNFIKVNMQPHALNSTATNSHPRKGYYWAINPAKIQALELEVEKTLCMMGRDLIENDYNEFARNYVKDDCSGPLKTSLGSQSHSNPHYSNSPITQQHYEHSSIVNDKSAQNRQLVIKNDINTLVLVNLLSMCAANEKKKLAARAVMSEPASNPPAQVLINYTNEEPCTWIQHECVVIDDNEDTPTCDDTLQQHTPAAKKRKITDCTSTAVDDHLYCHDDQIIIADDRSNDELKSLSTIQEDVTSITEKLQLSPNSSFIIPPAVQVDDSVIPRAVEPLNTSKEGEQSEIIANDEISLPFAKFESEN